MKAKSATAKTTARTSRHPVAPPVPTRAPRRSRGAIEVIAAPEGRPLPRTFRGWHAEIWTAFSDAAEALPFMEPAEHAAGPVVLFHLAPHVALKYRAIPERGRGRVVKAALASYVASQDTAGEALRVPILAFSLTYLAAHHALGLISEEQAMRTMDSLEALYGSGRALRKAMPNDEMHLTRSAMARRRGPRR